MDEEEHALTEFLSKRLPQLGLDAETYTPYLLPLLTDDEQDKDDDEWNGVLELLQASSETHSDDDAAWSALRADIEAAWREHQKRVAQAARAENAARQEEMQAQLAQERAEMEQALAQAEKQKASSATTTGTVNDAAKQALLSRFAFENDQDEDDARADSEEAPLSNKQVAAQALVEQARALRGQAVQTKAEERQKSKAHKEEKAKRKEERRNKATKGERKR